MHPPLRVPRTPSGIDQIRTMRHLLVTAVALTLVAGIPTVASAADVYDGYSKIGTVTANSSGRYDVKAGYSKVGDVRRSGAQFSVYSGYKKVGYVKRSGSQFLIYSGYSKVGYVRHSGSTWKVYEDYSSVGGIRGSTTGGPAGGAALLLILG